MNNKLKELERNRKEYVHVKWKSSGNTQIRIIDVDDSYLLNIMRSVSKSMITADHFPKVKEFQMYEGTKYSDWKRYLENEYLYRQEIVEQRYNEYKDKYNYRNDDRYDYGCISEIY